MEWLKQVLEVDIDLFLFLNGFHNQFWDNVMIMVSRMIDWLPLYVIVFYFVFKNFKAGGFRILLCLVALILLGLGLSSVIKESFQRLRPNHDPALSGMVHSIGQVAKYSFISSHAFNTMAAYTFSSMVFRNRSYSLFLLIWCFLIFYSRIYLGVHYPLDILGGAILGFLAGWLAYTILMLNEKYRFTKSSSLTAGIRLSSREARVILFIFGANFFLFVCISLLEVYSGK